MTRQRAARMSVEERRTAIIDAVLPLLEAHGEVSTRRIAEAAGIAEGTIFRVFPDKRALLLAAAERAVAPPGWREEMEAVLAAEHDLEGKVHVVTERLILRSRRVMLVMGALRRVLLTDGPPAGHDRHRPGPP